MSRGRLLARVLGSFVALGGTVAHAGPSVSTKTVRRFLSSYGYAHLLEGNRVALKSGERVPLSSIRTPIALFRLTTQLEQKPFVGLLGLRSDRGPMKVIVDNAKRADPQLASPVGPDERALTEARWQGRLDVVHDAALSQLVYGKSAVVKPLLSLATVYLGVGSTDVAQLVARKLGRVPNGEGSALLVSARIAAERDHPGRMIEKLDQLVALGANPRQLRTMAHFAARHDPKRALGFARHAAGLDPRNPESEATLGIATEIAARYDQYVDEDGRRGSVALLRRAVTEYEARHHDKAELWAKRVLKQDPDEALAHNLIMVVRGARLARAERVLLRDAARPPVRQRRGQQDEARLRGAQGRHPRRISPVCEAVG